MNEMLNFIVRCLSRGIHLNHREVDEVAPLASEAAEPNKYLED